MVAVDDSFSARRAAEIAAQLAISTGAELYVFGVADRKNTGGRLTSELVEGIAEELRVPGLEVSTEVWTDPSLPVSKAILDEIQWLTPYLVVLGTRRRGPIKGMVLGSVGADVLTNATCPVLIVP